MAKLKVSRFKDLDETRAHYLGAVDAEAERLRAKHITSGNGQAMTYEAKYREAVTYPEGDSFPFLEQEAESLGVSIDEVVQSILVARHRWQYTGSLIEARRLKAKKEIRAASTPAEMHRISKEIFDGLG